jgi:hypothetical protein
LTTIADPFKTKKLKYIGSTSLKKVNKKRHLTITVNFIIGRILTIIADPFKTKRKLNKNILVDIFLN